MGETRVTLWRVVLVLTGETVASGLLEYEANMIAMGWTSDGFEAQVEKDT